MRVYGDFHRRAQILRLERLDDVSVGTYLLGAFDGLLVRESSKEDNRQPELRTDACGRVDAVDVPFEMDVRQDEVRRQGFGHSHRLVSGGGLADDPVTELLERALEVEHDDGFVLNDENPRRIPAAVCFFCSLGGHASCVQTSRLIARRRDERWNRGPGKTR